jgi:hypothetical protein
MFEGCGDLALLSWGCGVFTGILLMGGVWLLKG